MEALWFVGTEKDLSYKDKWQIPEVNTPNDVKIKVAFSGVCGSDFHFMGGEMGKFTPKQDGVILGHEFSGVIVELGEEAKSKFQVGDKVCVNPNYCCGECEWAEEGFPHFCEANKTYGVKTNGGWAQFCVVPDHVVYKLPDNVTLEQGSLGEPYSCVLRGWNMLGKLPKPHVPVLVQGAGIIGSLFATLLHHHGYKNVTVAEPNDERRKLCAGMGLGFDVVHPQELELKLAGKDADKHGFQLIIDCTGNVKACQKALDFARRGATVSWFGCCPAGKTIPVEPFQVYWKELTIVGSFINPFCFEETMKLMEKLSTGGYLDYNKLGVKTFPLSDYKVALESLKSGKASKAMFKFPE